MDGYAFLLWLLTGYAPDGTGSCGCTIRNKGTT